MVYGPISTESSRLLGAALAVERLRTGPCETLNGLVSEPVVSGIRGANSTK